MNRYLFQLDALGVVRLLFWGTVVSTSALCFTDRAARSIVKTRWKAVLCALVLTLLWRIPTDGHFYHGLEYEDSYVYTVAARQVLERTAGNEAPSGFPYSISTCETGSLRNCNEWQTFPEHLIGTAYITSAYSRVMGYTPDAGAWVAVWAACLSCFLIILIASMISDGSVAATSGAIIFATTPIFAVQGLESSAEPLSNTAISIVAFLLVYVLRYFSGLSIFRASLAWLAMVLSIAFAMTIKRENALLVIAIPLLLLTLRPRELDIHRRRGYGYIFGLLSIAIMCGLFASHLNIAGTAGGEVSLLGQFRPTPSTVFRIVLSFMESLVIPGWYFCGFVFVAWGIFASRRQRLPLALMLIFLGYLALYAFHIRGYYELFSGKSDPRAALRFEMNLMSLWSVLAGLGVASAVNRIRLSRVSRQTWAVAAAGGVMLALLAISYAATRSLRTEAVEDEAKVRVAPAMKAVELATATGDGSGYVITFEPLVVQMFADPGTNVLDIDALDSEEVCKLDVPAGTAQAIFIDESIHHSVADAHRYADQLMVLTYFRRAAVYKGAGFTIETIDFAPGRKAAPCRQ